MDTFNLYMDETPEGEGRPGDEFPDVMFRLMISSEDTGDPENEAVLSGLDIYDLLDLRNAIQEVIDVVVVSVIDPQVAGDLLDEMENER